jgi:type IV secretory pathway protease TraF
VESINDEKDNFEPVILGEGTIFVLSDNRTSGLDSRNWGPIDERLVLGKISAIYWHGREKRILLKEVQ